MTARNRFLRQQMKSCYVRYNVKTLLTRQAWDLRPAKVKFACCLQSDKVTRWALFRKPTSGNHQQRHLVDASAEVPRLSKKARHQLLRLLFCRAFAIHAAIRAFAIICPFSSYNIQLHSELATLKIPLPRLCNDPVMRNKQSIGILIRSWLSKV